MPVTSEEPEIPKAFSGWQAIAYRDGWKAAANEVPRLPRPNYQTQAERDAYDLAWETRTLIGYLD